MYDKFYCTEGVRVCPSSLYLYTRSRVFLGVKKVVDLCAAPGSWSQVLARKIRYASEHEMLRSFLGIVILFQNVSSDDSPRFRFMSGETRVKCWLWHFFLSVE